MGGVGWVVSSSGICSCFPPAVSLLAFPPRLAVSYLVLFSTLFLSAVGTPQKSCLRDATCGLSELQQFLLLF